MMKIIKFVYLEYFQKRTKRCKNLEVFLEREKSHGLLHQTKKSALSGLDSNWIKEKVEIKEMIYKGHLKNE